MAGGSETRGCLKFGYCHRNSDPIDYEGGINLYGYVGNDPVNWIDPLGYAKDKPKIDVDPKPNDDGTINWRSSDGRSGTYDPATGTVTFTSEIVVTGTRIISTIDLVMDQPSDWPQYNRDMINYAMEESRYQVGSVIAEQLGTTPPKAPKQPTAPFVTARTIDKRAQDIQEYYARQRGWLNNKKSQAKAVFDVLRDIFGMGSGE